MINIPQPPKDEIAIAKVEVLLKDISAQYDLIKYSRKVDLKPEKERLKTERDNLKEQLKELNQVWLPIVEELDDIQLAILGYNEYESKAEYGVTSLSIPRYKKWVENNYTALPDESDEKLIRGLDSVFGNAFHNYAEKVVAKLIPNIDIEESIVANIEGYDIGGTADMIDRRTGKSRICDHKTTKTYSSAKALQGEVDKWVYQLSIYRCLLEANGETCEDFGSIYVWVTGWTPRDKDKTPKLYRMDIPLMTVKDTRNYIVRQIQATEVKPEMDCEQWLCTYCDLESVCPAANSAGFYDYSAKM